MKDEQLILYYYADGLSRAERLALEAALAADPALRERYEALQRELNDVTEEVIGKPPEYMVARWHDSIDRAAAAERHRVPARTSGFHLPSFAWGTALAATLVVGIAIGIYFSSTPMNDDFVEPGPTVANLVGNTSAGNAFTRGLQEHFQQSRQDINGLPADSSAERELLIMHIIQQNRLFARAAKENDSPELARVLRAFEPILARLSADDLSPAEAARLQAKLSFELNVMLTKMNQAPSNSSESI